MDYGRTFACSGYLLCGFGHTKHSSFSLLLSSISWQGRQWSGFLLHCNWAEAAHSFYPLTSAYGAPHHVSLAAILTYSDHSKLISDWGGLCLPLLHYGTCYVKGYSRNSKLTGYFPSCLAYEWPPSQAILWQAEGMWWSFPTVPVRKLHCDECSGRGTEPRLFSWPFCSSFYFSCPVVVPVTGQIPLLTLQFLFYSLLTLE